MKRTRLRKVSKARARELKAYATMRQMFLRKNPFCEFDAMCLRHSVDIHHIRGRRGNLLTDERYLMAICREHHDWIHSNSRKAREMGLLK
jgi:hypothetical protein